MARITWAKFKADFGLHDEAEVMDFLESVTFEGICPALCDEGCEVEPDGRCEHGCPSVMLALGII
jgi:hypothetical protein